MVNHTPPSFQQKEKRGAGERRGTEKKRRQTTKAGVVSRACSQSCARTTRHPPFQNDTTLPQ
nr:MAG TPA: hypothetical protein [Caudoviricetes sp.]